jgi:hypothetical protein
MTVYTEDIYTLCFQFPVNEHMRSNLQTRVKVSVTNVTQRRVNDAPHLRHTPLDHITKVLVVDVVVLLPNGSLSTLSEFILSITVSNMRYEGNVWPLDKTNILTRQSFARAAMILLSSLGCRPILPAKSSSLRLSE